MWKQSSESNKCLWCSVRTRGGAAKSQTAMRKCTPWQTCLEDRVSQEYLVNFKPMIKKKSILHVHLNYNGDQEAHRVPNVPCMGHASMQDITETTHCIDNKLTITQTNFQLSDIQSDSSLFNKNLCMILQHSINNNPLSNCMNKNKTNLAVNGTMHIVCYLG